MCFNCVFKAQIAYFESSLFNGILSNHMLTTTEPLEYWPQSELVSSQWVNDHLYDNNVRIVEVVYDSKKRKSNSVKEATTAILDWNEDIDHADYEDTQRQPEKYNNLL